MQQAPTASIQGKEFDRPENKKGLTAYAANPSIVSFNVVAGAGFEPTTFGL
jgi:hypothetical protein